MINHFSLRSLLTAATLAFLPSWIVSAIAQAPPLKPRPVSMRVLPLDQSASRGIVTRDPSTVVKCKDEYWVFYTGHGIPSYHSQDLVHWERGPRVFAAAVPWAGKMVPQKHDNIYWAPDVMRVGNQYFLYYSVSTIGSRNSAIGLATNPTLDPHDPAYHWTDHGVVVYSRESGHFNTIDPSIFRDGEKLWLVFGSYWSGIKLAKLNPTTGKLLVPQSPPVLDASFHSLAYHPACEASYLYKKGDYYYLFVNWDGCCRGPQSTYNIRVGRSKQITGPYLDKNGVNMLREGGSVFLASQGPLTGPGHAGIIFENGNYWFTCHFEADSRMGERATLAIMPLHWTADGWPEVELKDRLEEDDVPAGRYKKEVFSTNQYFGDLVYRPNVIDPQTSNHIDLKLNLFLPPEEDKHEKRPLIIFIHGGGFIQGNAGNEQLPWGITRAKLGYVAASVNYRLSQKSDEITLKERRAVEDVKKAIQWLRDHAAEYGIDPNRIALEGCSAGGITAMHVAYDRPIARYDLGIRAVASMWGAMEPEKLQPGGPALCLIHGTDDSLIPIAIAEKLRDRAAALGIPHEFHAFEGYGHELKDAQGKGHPAELSIPILTRFYAKHLAKVK